MISSIDIRKFRSCKNVKLDNLQDIVVLIGRNGAGKTSILKAIESAANFASGKTDELNFSNRHYFTRDIDISLTFESNSDTYYYCLNRETRQRGDKPHEPNFYVDIEEKLYVSNGLKRELVSRRSGESVTLYVNDKKSSSIDISVSSSMLSGIQALLPEKSAHRMIADKVIAFLGSVKYYPLHNFEQQPVESLVSNLTYQKWRSQSDRDISSLSNLMMTIIEMSEENPSRFEELKELVGQNGLGLISNIMVFSHTFRTPVQLSNSDESKGSKIFWINFSLPGNHEEQLFDLPQLSFGTIRLLHLLVSILHDNAAVTLLEQPEDGVHSALVDKLLPLLRDYSDETQFFIASHSTAVLNRSKATEVRVIVNSDGTSVARALSDRELIAAERYLREEGSLADFLESIEDN